MVLLPRVAFFVLHHRGKADGAQIPAFGQYDINISLAKRILVRKTVEKSNQPAYSVAGVRAVAFLGCGRTNFVRLWIALSRGTMVLPKEANANYQKRSRTTFWNVGEKTAWMQRKKNWKATGNRALSARGSSEMLEAAQRFALGRTRAAALGRHSLQISKWTTWTEARRILHQNRPGTAVLWGSTSGHHLRAINEGSRIDTASWDWPPTGQGISASLPDPRIIFWAGDVPSKRSEALIAEPGHARIRVSAAFGPRGPLGRAPYLQLPSHFPGLDGGSGPPVSLRTISI